MLNRTTRLAVALCLFVTSVHTGLKEVFQGVGLDNLLTLKQGLTLLGLE